MITIRDVERVLATKKGNLTARRWLNDPIAKKYILEKHNAWNEDHVKINEPSMIFSLEENLDYYLANPFLIDEEKEQPE